MSQFTHQTATNWEWSGKVIFIDIDATIPFGLLSAPLLFKALTDNVQWVVQQEGLKWILHYIDDFITIGAPDSKNAVIVWPN